MPWFLLDVFPYHFWEGTLLMSLADLIALGTTAGLEEFWEGTTLDCDNIAFIWLGLTLLALETTGWEELPGMILAADNLAFLSCNLALLAEVTALETIGIWEELWGGMILAGDNLALLSWNLALLPKVTALETIGRWEELWRSKILAGHNLALFWRSVASLAGFIAL